MAEALRDSGDPLNPEPGITLFCQACFKWDTQKLEHVHRNIIRQWGWGCSKACAVVEKE